MLSTVSGRNMAFKEFSKPSFSLACKTLFGRAFSRIGKEAYCTKALRDYSQPFMFILCTSSD